MRDALADPAAGLRALDQGEAERSLAAFIAAAWHVLEPSGRRYLTNWHIDAMAEHLEAVSSGRLTRLLVNVPPGSMKSLTISVAWPAWEWGPRAEPGLRIIGASYAERLSVRDSLRMRRLIISPWYQAIWGRRFTLVRDQNSKMRFENDLGGFRLATSVGGLGTGERGDRFIVDDPHNVRQAESRRVREETLRWFAESVPTRLNDPERSAIVVVMQRLHEKDVSGFILSRELGYEHLMLPMEFESGRRSVTVLGFRDPRQSDGELLWPERFSPQVLAELKRTLGPYAVAGQLQQRPGPVGGGLLRREWFAIVEGLPAQAAAVRHWDLAATRAAEGSDPDWTVGLKLLRDKSGVFTVADILRFRSEGAEVRRTLLNTAKQDGPSVRISLPQDPGQAGKAQAQDLLRLLAGYRVTARRETGDKLTRALPVMAQAEAGNVKLLKGAWNEAFLEEAVVFPLGAHKDQIDALSGAFAALLETGQERWFQ